MSPRQRRSGRISAAAWVIALVAACGYAPSPESGTQLCGASTAGRQCPDGYFCGAGRCWRNGTSLGGQGGGGHGGSGGGGHGGAPMAGHGGGIAGQGGAGGASAGAGGSSAAGHGGMAGSSAGTGGMSGSAGGGAAGKGGASGAAGGSGGGAGGAGGGSAGAGGTPPPTCPSCGARQTCQVSGTSAQCVCKTDALCNGAPNICADQATLISCARDGDGCFYQTSSSTCTNGACSGTAGSASCCTNACTTGATQCLSGTTLQTCALSGACTALTSSPCGSGLVCERFAPAACADPNWAAWPMPNSVPDVAAGAPNAQGYTANGDGTVTDKVTGLMWQQGTQSATWSQAPAACRALALGGYSDWRLPTKIELASLIDYNVACTGTTGCIDPVAFPSTPGVDTWTSTPAADSSTQAWVVHFATGAVITVDTSYSNPFRCVR